MALTTEHGAPVKVPEAASPELQVLFEEAKKASPASRRDYSKRIWRLRRRLRRNRARDALSRACALVKAPGVARSCAHINWGRILGEEDPSVVLSTFFADFFELEGDELEKAKRLKREWID